jgi:hypothetical protein
VTIYGTGFSATPAQDTVQFNGVTASITSATPNQIVASVPAGATTGLISVTSPSGSASSSNSYTVASNVTIPITPGGAAATASITSPGQNAQLTFTGGTGQVMTLSISGLTIPQCNISIQNPDGSNLVAPTLVAIGGVDLISVPTLPSNGTYTVLIAPLNNYTGNVTIQLVMDLVAPITPSGSAVQVNLVKGQSARLTFSGSAGQRVSVRMTKTTVSQSTASILNPSGSTLTGPVVVTNVDNDGFVDATTLPSAGTYTILISPQGEAAGGMTVNAYSVVDVITTITPGTQLVVNTTTPGQNVIATFTGNAGQSATLGVEMATTEINSFFATTFLKDPSGNQLTQVNAFAVQCSPTGCSTGFVGNFGASGIALPTTGTYTILLDPKAGTAFGAWPSTGSYTGTNYLSLSLQ